MAREAGGTVLGDGQPAFLGGLNTVSDDAALLPTQIRRATNTRLTDYGAISKRGGSRRTTASPLAGAAVRNGYTWRKDDGTRQIMAFCDGALRTTAFSDTYPWTWASPSGALDASASPSCVQFRDGTNDVVYIADGGLLNMWDGTTLSVDMANTFACTRLEVHNQRLWSCGNPAHPDSIFYSPLNNGSGLGYAAAGGGQIVVRTFGDEVVQNVKSVGTSLVILHRRGISRLTGYGSDDITIAPQAISADAGLIAPRSVVVYNNAAYFVTERGLYQCNEVEIAPIGTVEKPDPLLPILRNMSNAEVLGVSATVNRATRELWITMPGTGLFVYHLALQAWSGPWDAGFVSPETTCVFEALNDGGLPILLRGDASGYVSWCEPPGVGRDNVLSDGTGGTTYDMVVQFHRLYHGDDALTKAYRWGYLLASLRGSNQSRMDWDTGAGAGSFPLPVSTANTWGASGTTWGTGVWGGSGSTSYRIPVSGLGQYVDLTFVDSSDGSPVLSRAQVEAFSLGRR